MIDIPENVTLEWLGRSVVGVMHELRAIRSDLDMLTRIVIRVDHTVEALREDIRSLWLSQADLRRRIDALEDRQK